MSTWTHDGITYHLDRPFHSAHRDDPASGIGHHWRFTGEFTSAGVPLVRPVGTGDEDLIDWKNPLTNVIRDEGPLRQPAQPDPQHRAYQLTVTDRTEPIQVTGITRFVFDNHHRRDAAYQSGLHPWALVIDPARFVSLVPASAEMLAVEQVPAPWPCHPAEDDAELRAVLTAAEADLLGHLSPAGSSETYGNLLEGTGHPGDAVTQD